MSAATEFLLRLGVVLAVIGILVCFLAVGVDHVRDAADRVSCNLGGVALAFHNYQDVHGHLPPAVVYGKDGTPLHSWRVLILPYLSEDELHKEFRLDEPWDSPHNLALLPRMPSSYSAPRGKTSKLPAHHTVLHVLVGRGTPFEEHRRLKIPKDRSGDDTILFVEAGPPVPWTKPQELPYDPDGPLPELPGLFRWGFRACSAGGLYLSVGRGIDPADLPDLIRRKGGRAWDAAPKAPSPATPRGPE